MESGSHRVTGSRGPERGVAGGLGAALLKYVPVCDFPLGTLDETALCAMLEITFVHACVR